jgi:hypothetical protein
MKNNNYLKIGLIVSVIMAGLMVSDTALADSAHRLGVGLHYWVAVKDIDVDNVDENGYSWIFSYQYIPAGIFRIEADLELMQEGYAGSDTNVWSPQAYAIIGSWIYAGVGIGVNYVNDEFSKDPFYALRAGLDLEILPSIFLDINGNYRFENWDVDDVKEDVDTDTVNLGAVVRLEF